jgi:tetratricopeptide (TPR) repeat protein
MRVLALLLVLAALQDPPPLARARTLFAEAKSAEKSGGDFETPGKAAIAAFEEAIKAEPSSAEGYAGRGEVQAAMAAWWMPRGDFTKRAPLEAAIADFTKAIELDPSRAESYAGRGFAKFKYAVSRFFARVHVDELFKGAFEDFDRALALKPADASLVVLRAEAQYEKAVYARIRADDHRPPAEKAAAEFKEAARIDPSRAAELEARIAAALKLAASPVAVEDQGAPLIWSKTWELARREAMLRRVPIFFYVSGGAG